MTKYSHHLPLFLSFCLIITFSGCTGDTTSRHATIDENRHPAGERIVLAINDIEVAFRWCPPGTFMMGTNDPTRNANERPQHPVTLTRGFWMAETQVTQELWESVMENNPSQFHPSQTNPINIVAPSGAERVAELSAQQISRLPVERVSWNDSQTFVERLNEMNIAPPGFKFSLPTEAQWEYACRAGTTTAFYFGDTITEEQANFGLSVNRALGGRTAEVGSYPANAWGLYDMHGNLWEWCQDLFGYYSSGAVTDPTGADESAYRVARGGTWRTGAEDCWSSVRRRSNPTTVRGWDVGVRIALVRAE